VRAAVYSVLAISALWITGVPSRLEDHLARRILGFFAPYVKTSLAPEIAVILADEKQNGDLGPFGPDWRPRHAELIDALALGGASVVVFDIGFADPAPGDNEIAEAIRRAAPRTRVVLAAKGSRPGGRPEGISRDIVALEPRQWGVARVGVKSKDNQAVERVKLALPSTRSSPGIEVLSLTPSLALQAVAQHRFGDREVGFRLDRGRIVVEGAGGAVLDAISLGRDLEIPLQLPSRDTLAASTHDYHRVWPNRRNAGYLEETFGGKIVVVGARTADDLTQVAGAEQRYGYEVQAGVISALLQNSYARVVHPAVLWLPVPILAGVFAAAYPRVPDALLRRIPVPLKFLEIKAPVSWLAVAVALSYLFLAFVVYQTRRVTLEFACPVAVLLLADLIAAWTPPAAGQKPAAVKGAARS
jgi:CHASE2 domain-containing sensor protein